MPLGPVQPGPVQPGVVPPAASGFGPPPGPPAAATAPTGRSGGNLRRNTVWAFVGALLASAGWATAVIVVPDLVSTDSSPRSLGGYHLSDDFCATAKPSRLLQTYTVTTDSNSPSHHTDRNPALDSMNCSMSLKRTAGTGGSSASAEYASAYIRADLHKAVNPAPELRANKALYTARGYQATDLPGLGEEAYFLYKDDGSSTYHSLYAEVDVLDGGMTFYLTYNASYSQGKDNPPSMNDLRTALQADADNALRAMRK
ncbi:hypothetical protein [Kitasatospora sp. NPDC089509]|uniref:hypothetical protein n=1 Tax=Kitasatospora sp. NPDC089509 TaxID=3364079 RepID=UPI00380C6948